MTKSVHIIKSPVEIDPHILLTCKYEYFQETREANLQQWRHVMLLHYLHISTGKTTSQCLGFRLEVETHHTCDRFQAAWNHAEQEACSLQRLYTPHDTHVSSLYSPHIILTQILYTYYTSYIRSPKPLILNPNS